MVDGCRWRWDVRVLQRKACLGVQVVRFGRIFFFAREFFGGYDWSDGGGCQAVLWPLSNGRHASGQDQTK